MLVCHCGKLFPIHLHLPLWQAPKNGEEDSENAGQACLMPFNPCEDSSPYFFFQLYSVICLLVCKDLRPFDFLYIMNASCKFSVPRTRVDVMVSFFEPSWPQEGTEMQDSAVKAQHCCSMPVALASAAWIYLVLVSGVLS